MARRARGLALAVALVAVASPAPLLPAAERLGVVNASRETWRRMGGPRG